MKWSTNPILPSEKGFGECRVVMGPSENGNGEDRHVKLADRSANTYAREAAAAAHGEMCPGGFRLRVDWEQTRGLARHAPHAFALGLVGVRCKTATALLKRRSKSSDARELLTAQAVAADIDKSGQCLTSVLSCGSQRRRQVLDLSCGSPRRPRTRGRRGGVH